jgi:hypothetical protein
MNVTRPASLPSFVAALLLSMLALAGVAAIAPGAARRIRS